MAALAIAALVGAAATAEAGPCTVQIAQFERQIARAAPGPGSGPSGPQSVGAQLHHQPTAESIENAERQAAAEAAAALDRAKRADAEGDASACAKALKDAKELYGIE
ncbi:MAG TPA: hypothetical protein VK430_06700 [Xanthobacteraceae bacterium]|nr:hypothetical protein [Xanthobacteraceae bacterium]